MTEAEFVAALRQKLSGYPEMTDDEVMTLGGEIAKLVASSWPTPPEIRPLPPDYWETAE